MSAISANLATPPNNFSTTLSSGIGSSDLSVPLNSVSGLPTEGVGVIFTKDTNGDVVAGSVEIIHWTGIGGSSLTLTNTGDRGLTGSDAGAQAYSAGAYFEVWVTSYYHASLLSGVALLTPLTYLDTDGTLAANSDVKIATQKAVKTYVAASSAGADGWQPVSVAWTYASADAPTFTITVPSGAASIYGVGDRIKLTQTTPKYFIVTAVADTVLTVYGGTDYTLANAAISAIYYSHAKAPLGFPVDPSKWTQTTTSVTEYSQATPVQDTWYNLNAALSLVVPIGAWRLEYFCDVYATDAGNVTGSIMTTLSTANNSESNTDFTCRQYVAGTVNSVITNQHRGATVVLAAKATNYLNVKCADGGAVDSVRINVSLGSDSTKTVIRAICDYL